MGLVCVSGRGAVSKGEIVRFQLLCPFLGQEVVGQVFEVAADLLQPPLESLDTKNTRTDGCSGSEYYARVPGRIDAWLKTTMA